MECLKSYRWSQIGQAAAMAQKMMQKDPVLHLLVGETVKRQDGVRLKPFMLAFYRGEKKNPSQVGLRVSKI